MVKTNIKVMRGNDNIFTWKIGGKAGQGQQASGLIFSKACTRGGYYAFGYSEFPSLIRGGHVTSSVSVCSNPVSAIYQTIDLLVALNEETIMRHAKLLSKKGVIIFDSNAIEVKDIKTQKSKLRPLPLATLVQENNLTPIASNMIAVGASFGMLEYKFSFFKDAIKYIFAKKGKATIDMNIRAAEIGYEYAQKHFKPEDYDFRLVCDTKKKSQKGKVVLTSNDAVALSAVASGCRLYVAYPMSPSTSILHRLAAWQKKTGMVVYQPEDEIAGVHAMMGGMYAGTRSMISTSGGGFALMTEGITLSALTETPSVICVCSRGGPATGLPTWTEQGDLKFVVNAGHGDFHRIVLTPSDPQDAFNQTSLALNLAEKYQIPVIILMDKYLSDGHTTFDEFKTAVTVDRGKLVTQAQLKKSKKEYKRYAFIKDGVSPRSLPGMDGGLHLANSDEHDEYGYAIEGWHEPLRVKMVDKRNAKITGIMRDIPKPKKYGPKKARITLLGWGSTKGPVFEAMKQLPYVNYIHAPVTWPIDAKAYEKLLVGTHKLVCLENNSDAQFTTILRGQTGIQPNDVLLKYDGRQFFPEELVEKLQRMVK